MIEIEKGLWGGFYAFLAERKGQTNVQQEADVFIYDMSARLEEYRDPQTRKLLQDRIFPCIALYKALSEEGIPQAEAVSLLSEYFTMSLKGLVKRYGAKGGFARLSGTFPALVYGEFKTRGEGWEKQWVFYEPDRQQCNVTTCLYHTMFSAYDCAVLTKLFCQAERTAFEKMSGDRTFDLSHTIVAGDGFCDFQFVRR